MAGLFLNFENLRCGTLCRKAFRKTGSTPLLIAVIFLTINSGTVFSAENIRVSTVQELSKSVQTAGPGDVITLAPGIYKSKKIKIRKAGTKDRPITLRADTLGSVFIKSKAGVFFDVQAPYWVFENLDIEGDCGTNHSRCEHAFHIKGRTDGTVIRNNRMHSYNSMIKGNGIKVKENNIKRSVFPTDVLIENNVFFNPAPRNTRNPVNFVNLDGGRRWIVRGNLIADFAKSDGRLAAFGGYTKGMARDSVFERNLVICELMHHGGIRIGLSFGGGGTIMRYRDDPIGDIENLNGIMRNNIIINCPNDVGIYVNKGAGSKIYNNTLYNTYGIDVRFVESDAYIRNNIIGGGVRERDSGKATLENNLIAGTSVGMWLPGGSRYLQRRLDGQDKKFPNYVEKSDVEYVKSLVRRAIELVSETWVGKGNNSLESIFADPENGDLSLIDPDSIVDQGDVLPEVTDDFCGNPRRSTPPDLGAIEYGEKICDPAEMIRRAFFPN